MRFFLFFSFLAMAGGCSGGMAYHAFILGSTPGAHLHVDLVEPEGPGCGTPAPAPTPY